MLFYDALILISYGFGPLLIKQFQKTYFPNNLLLEVLLVLSMWLPMEFRWLPALRVGPWEITSLIPTIGLLYIYTQMTPWTARRDGTGTLGIRWLRKDDVKMAILGLLGFMAIGIPVGFLIGFLEFGIRPLTPLMILGLWVGNFCLIALPEELLFRGVIQNHLERSLPQKAPMEWVSLGIAAFIFGIAHVNNRTIGFDVPNWGYVLMATLAGLFYGYVWRRTGSVFASTITHATTNTVWVVALSGGG